MRGQGHVPRLRVAGVALLLRCSLHMTLVDWVDQRNLTVRPIVVSLPVRGSDRPVRVQGLLAGLRSLAEPFNVGVTLLCLLPGGRLHTMIDGRAWRDESLLAVADVAVVQAVSGRSAARVLCMLRNRVL